MSRLPDFYVLGAAKSGTTSLARWLSDHPAIYIPAAKELKFFSDDSRYPHELEAYARAFAPARPGQLCGEATPLYLFFPDAIARIARTTPDARLIALLREPGERAYSNWRHRHHRAAVERRPFAQVVDDEIREHPLLPAPGAGTGDQLLRYLTVGRYAEELAWVDRHFPPERLLVLLTDELRDDPRGTFLRVCRFLGIAEEAPASVGTHVNEHREFRPVWLWHRLVRWRVLERLGRAGSFVALRLMLREGHRPPPIDASTRARLDAYFAGPNAALARRLGRELPASWTARTTPSRNADSG